ncbi:MAG: helix-turn-helix transcriptional regulator [Novosphingobium sp.]|nr:helix-turn-helix transcriptional regulator [Novosphingobium sp.]
MGAEGLNFDSPAQQPLAGTHIAYEVDRRVRLGHGIVELGKFRWCNPVELVIRHQDDIFAFNLALSPRPARARISRPGQIESEDLESIGRVVLIHPGSTFRLSVPSGQVRSLYCGIDRDWLRELLGKSVRTDETGEDIFRRLNLPVVELLLNRIYEELRDDRFGSVQAIEAYAGALRVELARAILAGSEKLAICRKGGLAPGRMRLLKDRIHADAPAPQLSELADLCGMTVRQISRAFKQETGQTLGKYIDEIAMERAYRLLTESDLAICEIAASLGFSNPASFSYAFRRSTGVAPSQLRRRSTL